MLYILTQLPTSIEKVHDMDDHLEDADLALVGLFYFPVAWRIAMVGCVA